MAKLKINGRLSASKGGVAYIGADTEVTHIDKDDAKKYGINAAEFAKLKDDGILVEDDSNAVAKPVAAEPAPLSAALFKRFSGAVEKLDSENQKHWTEDGKPEIAALKEAGCIVTVAERDEAWELFVTE